MNRKRIFLPKPDFALGKIDKVSKILIREILIIQKEQEYLYRKYTVY